MASADEQDASACCATVFEALREPGFRQLCAASLLDADASVSGFVFLECPLAALKTVAKLLPMTADRPAEQRFKPLLARARAVSTSDVHLVSGGARSRRASQLAAAARLTWPRPQALGVPAGHAAAGGVAAFVQSTSRDTGFVVVLSVGLTPTTAVALAAALAWQAGDAAAALRTGQLLQCAPSAWVDAALKARKAAQAPFTCLPSDARPAQPANAKPAPAPAAVGGNDGASEDGELLFCTNRGKGRSKKRPLYQWTGRLRPHPISPYRAVAEHIDRPDYATTGWPADEMESKKQNVVHLHTPKEVAGIRAACQLVRSAREFVARCMAHACAARRAAKCSMRAPPRCGQA